MPTQVKKVTQQIPELTSKDEVMATKFAKSLISSFFSQGYLTKEDLSLSQKDFYDKLKELVDRSDISIGVDHRDDIIKKADILLRQKDYEYAKILYAMFFEHSINHLISHECQKRKIDEKTKVEIIKSIDIYGKLTWLPKLLGFPKFNDTHRLTIKKLSDDRNAFVHYKWKTDKKEDRNKISSQSTDEEFKKIKVAVKYMKQYATNLLFQKNKKHLDNKLKRK